MKKIFILLLIFTMSLCLTSCKSLDSYSSEEAYQLGVGLLSNLKNECVTSNSLMLGDLTYSSSAYIIENDSSLYVEDRDNNTLYKWNEGYFYKYTNDELVSSILMEKSEFESNYVCIQKLSIDVTQINTHKFEVKEFYHAWGGKYYEMDHDFSFDSDFSMDIVFLNTIYNLKNICVKFLGDKRLITGFIIISGNTKIDGIEKEAVFFFTEGISYSEIVTRFD